MGDEIACVELTKWLYNDVLAAELEGLARQLKLQALVSEKAVVMYSTWRHAPTTYLVCEMIGRITPETQRFNDQACTRSAASRSRLRAVVLVTGRFCLCWRRLWRLSTGLPELLDQTPTIDTSLW
jgi:hypothetical protein